MRRNKRALISAAFALLMYLVMLAQPLFDTAIDNYGAAM